MEILVLEEAEQHGLAVGVVQFAECGIKMRSDVFPRGIGVGGKQFFHGGGLLFTGTSALACEAANVTPVAATIIIPKRNAVRRLVLARMTHLPGCSASSRFPGGVAEVG